MNKPAEEPKVSEPEQQTAAHEASVPQPSEPVLDIPLVTPDLPIDQANNDPLNPEASSPIKTAHTQDDDVVITNICFREPRRPIALAKHSAKEEHIEQRRVRFLSQVQNSRELEVDMVKQMHQKFEV